MSQWHHARGRWGQRRGFSGRWSAWRKGGKHIPERWKDYLPVGQRMPGTPFIAVKVPLKNGTLLGAGSTAVGKMDVVAAFWEFTVRDLKRILLQENVSPPWIFSNKLQEHNEELGLIIDLTYTRRYYKPESLAVEVEAVLIPPTECFLCTKLRG